MSVKLMSLAMQTNLVPSKKLVLIVICDHANDDGCDAFPSISKIARKSSLSERQTQRVLRDLERDGYIAVVGNPNGGRPGSTKILNVNVRRLETGDTHVTGDNMTRVTSVTETGDMGDRGRVTPVTQTGDMGVTLTILNHPITTHNHPARARDRKKINQEKTLEGFDNFWKLYPRREGKGQAEKAYAQAIKSGIPPDKIVSAAQAYAASKAGTEPRFIRLPSTWINGKGWEDECAKPPDVSRVSNDHWRSILSKWVETAHWPPANGPEPHEQGCLCPPAILRDMGLRDAV